MSQKDYDEKLKELKNSKGFLKDFNVIDQLEKKQNEKKDKLDLEKLIGKDGEVLPIQTLENQNSFDDTSNPL